MADLPPFPEGGMDRERLDQFTRFLTATIPTGYEGYYNERKQLFSKELSVGNIEREDILSFVRMIQTSQEMLRNGQDELAREIMIELTSEFKMSMSKEGEFVNNLLQNKIEYMQTQNVHEYQHPTQKKGLLFNRKPKGE